jgi:hypothetical protein
MKAVTLLFATAALASAARTNQESVTFHRDVLPVLQKNCQGCHRPGEAAPMSLLTYKEVRPLARAIRESVLTKKMPPWFADPHSGKFSNDRSLSKDEIATLVKWADTGAPEGNPKDAPAPKQFVEGWNIGTPDFVVEMPAAFEVPQSGTIEYTYFVLPTGFTEDKWVQLAEARPGNRAVVHHVIAFIREPGSKWLQKAKPGVPYVPEAGSGDRSGGNAYLIGYAPGTVPAMLSPGQAKLVKAGSDIVLQMHYTANGKKETDRTRIGMVFAKQPPTERVVTLAAANSKFVIPPGADNHQVDSKVTLQRDATLISLLPHMHLRGKDFEYRIIYPTGEKQTILSVPKYSFSWQLSYLPEKPLLLPKGTIIECTAHFDNSPNNPSNPDPKSEVRFGEQSWEEMMIGFFDVAINVDVDPKDLLRGPMKKTASDD